MSRIALFVDAGYVFAQGAAVLTGAKVARTRLILDEAKIVRMLCEFAESRAEHGSLLRVYWYDGAPQRGINAGHIRLGELDNVKVRLGSINAFNEQKGVDSLLIADLIQLAQNRAIDAAVLLSGDADLRVGVEVAQAYGVRVHLLGFEGPKARASQSGSLIAEADTRRLWDEAAVSSFLAIAPPLFRAATPMVPFAGTSTAGSAATLESETPASSADPVTGESPASSAATIEGEFPTGSAGAIEGERLAGSATTIEVEGTAASAGAIEGLGTAESASMAASDVAGTNGNGALGTIGERRPPSRENFADESPIAASAALRDPSHPVPLAFAYAISEQTLVSMPKTIALEFAALQVEIERFVDLLTDVDVDTLLGVYDAQRQIPYIYDARILRLSRTALLRDLDPAEKRFVRACVLDAIRDRQAQLSRAGLDAWAEPGRSPE